MLQDRNIALFIDVDNCNLEYSHFDNAVVAMREAGNLIYGKVYGVSDRKSKDIIEAANNLGFDTAPVVRIKKRGSRVFDNRITVDIMDTILSYSHIDTVCVVAAPTDMVYLFRKLHTFGIKIMAMDNLDAESSVFVDEFIDIGYVEPIKPVAKKRPNPFIKKQEAAVDNTEKPIVEEVPQADSPVQQQPVEEVVAEAQTVEEAVEEPVEEPIEEQVQQEQPVEEPTPEAEKLVEEDKPIENTVVEEVLDDEPKEEESKPVDATQINVGGNDEDAEILRQIEKVRNSQSTSAQDDEKLLAEIKRLLAEFDADSQ